jgi:plastocyanin
MTTPYYAAMTRPDVRISHRGRRTGAAVALALALGTGAAACGSSGSSSAAKSGSGGSTSDKIDIKNFAFNPSNTTVKVGTTVTWTMQDASTTHTVTASDGTFDSGDLSQVGKTFPFTFTKAGTFTYKCSIHNSMTGTIVVK